MIEKTTTDSSHYYVLTEAAELIKDLPIDLLTCEIGLRLGGGTSHILDGLYRTEQYGRTHIAIDPYGNIEYQSTDDRMVKHDYTNNMKHDCMVRLNHQLIEEFKNKFNFVFINLCDEEFFSRYADGVPVYQEEKKLLDKYALIHYDGPHDVPSIMKEVDFFIPRTVSGSMFVFDDIPNYNHAIIDDHLLDNDFTVINKTERKISYRKN